MIGSRARPSAYQIRKILFAPGARGVCHDPEKPFFGDVPSGIFPLSKSTLSADAAESALATTRHRHFPSKAASRDQANDLTIRTCDPYLPAGIPMPAPLRFVKRVNSKIR